MAFKTNPADGEIENVGDISFKWDARTRRRKIVATGAATGAQRSISASNIVGKAVTPPAINLAVSGYGTLVPPGAPIEGEVHIVGVGPSGVFVGHDGQIAVYSGGWSFFAPYRGLLFIDPSNGKLMSWSGSAYYEVVGAIGSTVMAPFQSVAAVLAGSSAALAGGAPNTADGYALSAGDRVLVIGHTNPLVDGIYAIATLGSGANGTWGRATDADTAAEHQQGRTVYVMHGTTKAGFTYAVQNLVAPVPGTTAISFVLSGATGIPDNGITTDKLQNSSVTSAKIAASAVGSSALAAGAVIDSKIADGAVKSTAIAANAVTTSAIAPNAVGTAELANGAVDTNKLKNEAVTFGKLAVGAADRQYASQAHAANFSWPHALKPNVKVAITSNISINNLTALAVGREYSLWLVNSSGASRTVSFGDGYNNLDGTDIPDTFIPHGSGRVFTFVAASASTLVLVQGDQAGVQAAAQAAQLSLGKLFTTGKPRHSSIVFGVGNPGGQNIQTVVQWSANGGASWMSSAAYGWGVAGRGPFTLDIHYNGGTEFDWVFVGYSGQFNGSGVNNVAPGEVRMRLAGAAANTTLTANVLC